MGKRMAGKEEKGKNGRDKAWRNGSGRGQGKTGAEGQAFDVPAVSGRVVHSDLRMVYDE